MATIEQLDQAARQKLTAPDGRRSECGIFLMPAEMVSQWYVRSSIPSAFRGLYLRNDAELEIIISDSEHYRQIKIDLALPRGKAELAHRLEFHNNPREQKEPVLWSVDMRGFLFSHLDRRTPHNETLEDFVNFIESADDYNLLLPIELHPDFYYSEDSTSGIILPRFKKGIFSR